MLVKDFIAKLVDKRIKTDGIFGDKNEEVKKSIMSPLMWDLYQSMELWDIRGIGPINAVKLWNSGIRLTNLQEKKDQLPLLTQTWLKYKPMSNIPRATVTKIFKEFAPMRCKLSGSWRREEATSNDLDVLVNVSVRDEFLKGLKKFIITSEGPAKVSGIFKSKEGNVEVDIFFYNKDEEYGMLLYTTGSKRFNIVMRAIAHRKGYLLNQHGLHKDGKLLNLSEKEIFEHLGMEYRHPRMRK